MEIPGDKLDTPLVSLSWCNSERKLSGKEE